MMETSISVNAYVVADLDSLLSGDTSTQQKDGSTIQSFTGVFANGWEADIKVVSGGSDCLPYVDPVLFDETGCEVYPLEADRETVVGIYRWEVGDQIYTVTIKSD